MTEQFLRNKNAWIIGGASGMGKAIAIELARAGANIAIGSLITEQTEHSLEGELVNLPTRQQLETTAEEIGAFGGLVVATNLDVCTVNSLLTAHQQIVATLGNVDILVNAAGITTEQTICQHSDAVWHRVIDVNLHGCYRSIRLCLPTMIEKRWGRIINIASTAASVGAAGSAAYCASKAGLVALSRCVALEGAEFGVTCNSISPGWVETDFGNKWMEHIANNTTEQTLQEYITDVRNSNPQKRIIQPSEIAALAAFLCKEQAKGITMQDLTVSGGSLW